MSYLHGFITLKDFPTEAGLNNESLYQGAYYLRRL